MLKSVKGVCRNGRVELLEPPPPGADGQVIGVVGVIGPTRLNYARVIPMVDFTAQALTRRMP